MEDKRVLTFTSHGQICISNNRQKLINYPPSVHPTTLTLPTASFTHVVN